MLYRWGFIENGVFSECKPIVDDEAALDFAPETGQIFYRAKLNGDLSFRFEFEDILAKGYDYNHIIALEYYDNADDSWKEMWRGHFTLTDCEIDFDSNTISVQPETLDRYTDILANMDTEYNLLKLAPEQQSVDIMIRPCFQVYALNDSKIMNLIGGNTWQASCDAVGISNIDTYKFRLIKNQITIAFTWQTGAYAGQFATYTAEINVALDPGTIIPLLGKVYSGNDWVEDNTLHIIMYPSNDYSVFGVIDSNTNVLLQVYWDKEDAGSDFMLNYQSADVDDIVAQWNKIYARLLLQNDNDTWRGQPLYDLASDDMAGTNLNYNKISQITPIGIIVSDATQEDVTQWGLSYTDRYFIKPTGHGQIAPIGQDLWKYVSYWFFLQAPYYILDADGSYHRQIRDCYTLKSAIVRLLEKAGWTGNQCISKILDGTNDYVGEAFIPLITPKSNVISSYYDTPAQKAPITLSMLLTMLKQAYKCYWFIDSSNVFHVEHISYFENGYSYTEDEPVILVDLEAKTHTRTYENKVFGQNKVKFDKGSMPQHYNFAWMEKQTQAFDGFPIDSLDAYALTGQTEDIAIGDFDTDLDYVLCSPNDVSKDGFFLFLCPAEGGVSDYAMEVEELIYKDDAGDINEITMQNVDGAFVKIHDSFWRYDLPCENVTINNEDSTAKTTGRFKVQTIEFADESMTDILADISNCVKSIRTQQGNGHIKSLSINLNSLAAKADLLFNFVGRWYYLRGSALGASITIFVNGESTTIDVSGNVFKYRYNEPISALNFNAADVVSVNLADCDSLENLTSTQDMFKNCSELLAVDFANKKLGAVTDATDMFAGCSQLTTLICPATSTWKPDLNFEDCPALTTESVYSLIGYLFDYESGTHIITFNQTMWNALDPDIQTDIEARANAKGWQIGMAAAYFISGTSSASVVYATIDGSAVEIEVENGAFNYGYRSPITSLSFEADTNVTSIDFSLSDGLAGVTTLDDAFKGCTSLTSVNFTDCDLSNVASASDCFANCAALTNLTIPTGIWKPDVDFSTCPLIANAEMQDIIGGLYTYTSGTHTITWNTTYWDSLTQAQQQTISDAASAKGWSTNAVMVIYYIRGTSTNVNGTETFTIQFIQNGSLTPSAIETITCTVDGNGDFDYQYLGKKIYSLTSFAQNKTTITQIEFSEDFSECMTADYAFSGCSALTSASFANAIFSKVTTISRMFDSCANLLSVDFENATFAANISIYQTFYHCTSLTSVDFKNATFATLLSANGTFNGCTALISVDFSNATFAETTDTKAMFFGCTNLTTINWSANLNFNKLEEAGAANTGMFQNCTSLASISAFANQQFTALKNAARMFSSCTALTSVDFGNATFAALQNTSDMLNNCTALSSVDFSNATFASVTNANQMFRGCTALTSIDLSKATFAVATNVGGMFRGLTNLVNLDMSVATFASVTNCLNIFTTDTKLANVTLTSVGTAFALSATAANIAVATQNSPLTYASMLNFANWLHDRTGYAAPTITFKASAWSALSSAEQTTIDGILSGKNWNRAIA